LRETSLPQELPAPPDESEREEPPEELEALVDEGELERRNAE
jgi:hypothetical protein